MLNVYAASHVCGLASAAIIERWGVLRKQSVKTKALAFHQMKTIDCANQRVMLCDVPFSIVQKMHADIAYCSSHQEESADFINSLKKKNIIVDAKSDFSCASLLASRLLPHDGVAKLLASAADSTLNDTHNDFAAKVEDILHANFDVNELITLWRKGVLWPDHVEKFLLEARVKKQQALETLRNTIDVRRFLTTNVGYVRISAILSPREAAKEVLAAHSAVEVAVVIANDGHVTFRSRNNVDVLQIARQFGGGGQPYAAGAKIFDCANADSIEKLNEKLHLLFPHGLAALP